MQTSEVTEFYHNYGNYARSLFGYKRDLPRFVVSSPESHSALAETVFFIDRPEVVVLNHLAFPLMDEDEVTHVITHEIAHVIAGVEAQHGDVWANTCSALGIVPFQFFTLRRVDEWFYSMGYARRARSEFREPTLGWL